eukprot:6344069-Amphidinium_carterae.1
MKGSRLKRMGGPPLEGSPGRTGLVPSPALKGGPPEWPARSSKVAGIHVTQQLLQSEAAATLRIRVSKNDQRAVGGPAHMDVR